MLVGFDTETTGFTHNHIVELASHIELPNGDTFTWYSKAKPSTPIEQGAFDTHGISNEQVANERPDTEVVAEWWADLEKLEAEYNSPMVLVAHNKPFDVRVLRKYEQKVAAARSICTVKLGRLYNPEAPNHKLVTLHEHLGLTGDYKAHSAMDDVYMCVNILKHYMRTLQVSYYDLADRQEQAVVLTIVPIGKYKGDPVSTVPVSYMEYMLGFADLDPDLHHTFTVELARRGVPTKKR